MTEKCHGADAKAELIETILYYEDRIHCNIYGMKFCQLCGKKQEYESWFGALNANSCNPFRCRECRIGRGKELLDKWFKGSMKAVIKSRGYVICQFCGGKVRGIKSYRTKVRDLCYLCLTCHRDFLEKSRHVDLRSRVWWRQCRRLYLQQLGLFALRERYENNLRALDVRRRNTLKLVNQ